MISFKNKKAGRIWCKKLRRALQNLQEMCLYISGGPELVKTLQFGCMQYRALADYSAKARLRSLIGEYGDFRILRSLNESQTLDPDIRTLFANFNTRNERCEKKRSRFLSSAKRSSH